MVRNWVGIANASKAIHLDIVAVVEKMYPFTIRVWFGGQRLHDQGYWGAGPRGSG